MTTTTVYREGREWTFIELPPVEAPKRRSTRIHLRPSGYKPVDDDGYNNAIDEAAYTSWVAKDMPGPEGYTSWTSVSLMPHDMTRYAYEMSLDRVETMLRELEPEERRVLEARMTFKRNSMQAAKFLGLPRQTYVDRLKKAQEHAKQVVVRFYQWGDEPPSYTDDLNKVRHELGEMEFTTNTRRHEAVRLRDQLGARRAAERLGVSKATLYRIINQAA